MIFALTAGVLALSLYWIAGRWVHRRSDRDLGFMSQHWIAEQRLSRLPDPQR